MTERVKRIAPIAILLLALVIALVWGGIQRRQQYTYRQTLENMYERSFYELVDNIGNMEVQISKLLVTETPEQSLTLLTDVWHKAGNAQSSFALLPVSIEHSSDTVKFVNQVGDYCLSLSQKVMNGQPITLDQREQLQGMQQRLTTLGNNIRQMQAESASGEALLWESALSFGQSEGNGMDAPLDNIGRAGVEYPSLIYDGPFSDASTQPPKGLSGQWVSYEEAERIARAFVGEQRVEWALPASESLGEIPTWGVEMMLSRDGVVTVQVTKQGGHVLWMMAERIPADYIVSLDDCYQNAVAFLREHGYPECDLNYYQAYEGIAVLNFVPLEQDILLYPDLIKVQVSLETGQIVGFEAGNYLRNHVEREFAQPTVTPEEATALGARLDIERVRLCLIPQLDQEILCYEITGTFLGERYLMYIDAVTGMEVNLYKQLDVEGGQLVM